ncbi:MAG: hypothetical protein JKX97_02100 [Candidatus Lindowbacteria bacterium]|nr:hypothetical protein [Candidatus Lindowbacteria bacterium]
MSGFVFLSVGIGFLAFLFVVEPLLSKEKYTFFEGNTSSKHSEKDTLLSQIRDLDLEHEAGKIETTQYERLRNELIAEVKPYLNDRN